jgi:hypothetical protein
MNNDELWLTACPQHMRKPAAAICLQNSGCPDQPFDTCWLAGTRYCLSAKVALIMASGFA